MLNNYEAFKEEVFRLTRIDLNAYKERQMKRRIDALIAKHGIKSYPDYVNVLKQDKNMFDEFVNYLTINVSEFYRNPEQWALLEKEILPYLFDSFGKNIKIWSAACSTGDEPYSLVMLLSKFMPLNKIKVIATDIDKQVLDKARMGLYNDKSLKALPKEFIDKYFNKVNDRAYQINDSIKACVEFKQHNLLKDEYPMNCDLIICRNVLIYFTEEAKNDIYMKFNRSLKKDGILFVGSTEQIIQPQMLGYSSHKSFFYKKV
ncbi:CheR family methyltransferase [Anaeromicropila herbilytica]|uniref:protein-glutamate O-methyltransferase n=1 Tax=Anaeromicropila herbilytica TaxID=2785025 RepID=A0A7R7EM85_9FIRM|nr:protein-glutamate O-methyltransferase CheR [Anaeromicropila herbilytica]BCN31419.1 chemotaxis protein methyltransferase [Anaeromicropila herbilytica]